MKYPSRIFRLAPLAVGVVVLVGGGMGATPAFARKKNAANQLQIWPGQRVLVVLPLAVSPNFLDAGDAGSSPAPATMPVPVSPASDPTPPVSAPADGSLTAAPTSEGGAMTASTGSGELAAALVPVVSSDLSRALQRTGKFSIVLPYKFDPLLRRAAQEQKISDDDINAFVLTPSLEAAGTMFSKLDLEQPGMVAQVALESLQVGGTAASPTVQVRMRGDIYQALAGLKPEDPPRVTLFRTITVTSKPYTGNTPEDRLKAASNEAFNDIAAAFVEAPTEFQLPVPVGQMSGAKGAGTGRGSGASMGGAMTSGAGGMMGGGRGTTTPLSPATPGEAPITTPNAGSPTLNTPVAPTLPPATPPLGLNVPAEGN